MNPVFNRYFWFHNINKLFMKLDQNSGAEITLSEAQAHIKEFQMKNPDEVKSFFIGSNHIKSILDQEGCIGLRIYNGINLESSRMNQVLIGVNELGNDIKEGVIVNKAIICPPECSIINILD